MNLWLRSSHIQINDCQEVFELFIAIPEYSFRPADSSGNAWIRYRISAYLARFPRYPNRNGYLGFHRLPAGSSQNYFEPTQSNVPTSLWVNNAINSVVLLSLIGGIRGILMFHQFVSKTAKSIETFALHL